MLFNIFVEEFLSWAEEQPSFSLHGFWKLLLVIPPKPSGYFTIHAPALKPRPEFGVATHWAWSVWVCLVALCKQFDPLTLAHRAVDQMDQPLLYFE